MKIMTKDGWKRFDVSEPVNRIFDEFEYGVLKGDKEAYAQAIRSFKQEWDISPMQEAAICIILSDTEVLYKGCSDMTTRRWHAASARNILECVVKGYWEVIGGLFLSERNRTVLGLDEPELVKYLEQ